MKSFFLFFVEIAHKGEAQIEQQKYGAIFKGNDSAASSAIKLT